MSSNIREFDLALKTHGAKVIPEQARAFQRAVTLEAAKGVILMTPVDEGRARGAWMVTQDEPALGEPGTIDKAGGGTLANAAAAISKLAAFSLAWITNNVPYIERLEAGSSKQAPKGMVAVTLARLKAAFG